MYQGILLRLAAAAIPALPIIAHAAEDTDPAATAEAEDSERKVAFSVGTGLEYDSNVAVLELDATSAESDVAALLDFGIGYTTAPTERFRFAADYSFSDSRHSDFEEFDVRINRGSATASFDFGRADAGVSFHYALADLDGTQFMTLSQASPYVATLIGDRMYVRFAYAMTDKTFDTSPSRDATTDSLDAETFVFINGVKQFLSFGYRYDKDDAVAAQFDYAANKLRFQFSQQLPARSRSVTLKTYVRYEDRDYESLTPSIGEVRDDERFQIEALAEIPLTEKLLTQISYKYSDNQSNLPTLHFDESVFSVAFRAEL